VRLKQINWQDKNTHRSHSAVAHII